MGDGGWGVGGGGWGDGGWGWGMGDGGWGMGGGGLKAVEEENSIIIKALLR